MKKKITKTDHEITKNDLKKSGPFKTVSEMCQSLGIKYKKSPLQDTFDAMVWTKEFMKVAKRTKIDKGLMLGWFANAIMAGHDYAIRNIKMTASEGIYGFISWLTCRKEKTVLSSSTNCGKILDLMTKWIDCNELETPRDGHYPDNIKHPKIIGKKQKIK
jgi:hypothetical protein